MVFLHFPIFRMVLPWFSRKMSWGVSFLRPMASVTGPALAAALSDVLRTRRFRAAVRAAQQDLAGGVQRLAEELLEL